MALPASDDFHVAGITLGANWHGGCQSNGTVAFGLVGGVFNIDWWTADAFNNDQYSQCVFATANADCAVAARVTDALNFYMLYNQGSGGLLLFKRVAGSFTSLNNFGGTVVNGDTIKLECIGTALHCYKNGSELSGSPIADATFGGGAAGIVCFGSSAASSVDDFLADNTGGAVVIVPPVGLKLRQAVKRASYFVF